MHDRAEPTARRRRLRAAVQLCRAAGLELHDVETRRVAPVCGLSAHTPDGPVWLRVCEPDGVPALARELAAAVAGAGATMAPRHPEVLTDRSAACAVFEYLDPVAEPGPTDLAAAVAALHEVPPPDTAWSWRDDTVAWLTTGAAAGTLSAGDAERLCARAVELHALLDADPGPLGVGFVHGDAHPSNLVVTATGPVLVDLATAGAGPLAADLGSWLWRWQSYRGVDDPRVLAGYYAAHRRLEASAHQLLADRAVLWAAEAYGLFLSASAVEAAHVGQPGARDEAAVRVDAMCGRPRRPWVFL